MIIKLSEKLKSYSKEQSKNKILVYMTNSPCCTLAVAKFYAKYISNTPDLKKITVDGIEIFYQPYIENFLEEKEVELDLVKILNVIIVNY